MGLRDVYDVNFHGRAEDVTRKSLARAYYQVRLMRGATFLQLAGFATYQDLMDRRAQALRKPLF